MGSDVIDDILAERDLWVDHGGWLHAGTTGPRLYLRPMHPSWYYAADAMITPEHGPDAIIVHSSWTNPGTASNMARRRKRRRQPGDRAASWHVTIETDGTIYQMAPFDRGTWHAGVGDWNRRSVGVEFVGRNSYTQPQVLVAGHLWRALVQHYGIAESRAFIGHSTIKSTKSDPGPEWLEVEPRVRAAAFG